MNLLLADINLDFLKKFANEIEFSFFHSDDDRHFISCFVAHFPNNQTCEELWQAINNEIAIEYQSSLQDDFLSWNIYLILVTPSPMKKRLKYRIENDRFALRKIVLTGPAFSFKSNSIVQEALENSILGKDLKLSDADDGLDEEPEKSNRFREFLSTFSKLPLDGKESSLEIRRRCIRELLEHKEFLS